MGEIEQRLLKHPSIARTVVVSKVGVAGYQELVAYVVTNVDSSDVLVLDDQAFRMYLKQHLPSYMIPSAFVTLEALPLTTSGKINRNALPEPERNRLSRKEELVLPTTALEIQIAQIWKEVLKIEGAIGIHNDFFDLGGHSLLATQVVSRLNEQMKMQIPLRLFFENPSIAQLAKQAQIIIDAKSILAIEGDSSNLRNVIEEI